MCGRAGKTSLCFSKFEQLPTLAHTQTRDSQVGVGTSNPLMLLVGIRAARAEHRPAMECQAAVRKDVDACALGQKDIPETTRGKSR